MKTFVCSAVAGAALAFGAMGAEISCIEELELPRFAVVNGSPGGETVTARIEFGREAPLFTLTSIPKEKRLEEEVRYHLGDLAKYRRTCTGTVELQFIFKVEGRPTYAPYTRVLFRPPNAFVIITQPVLPSVDIFPLEDKAPKTKSGTTPSRPSSGGKKAQ